MKDLFIQGYDCHYLPSILVLIIQTPSKSKEVIINTNNIEEKFRYILDAYTEELELKSCKEIKILQWVFA
jgi:hypothetical protein